MRIEYEGTCSPLRVCRGEVRALQSSLEAQLTSGRGETQAVKSSLEAQLTDYKTEAAAVINGLVSEVNALP